MRAEAASVVWRVRSRWEGGDLGVHVLQSAWRNVYRCYVVVALPLFLAFAVAFALAPWAPLALIWWSKPWLDRTILFALSRAVFGEATRPADLWHARASVWRSQWLSTVTLRRLSASRSVTQPILQLEGLTGARRRARIRLLAGRHRWTGRFLTQCFAAAEAALWFGCLALTFWLAPHHDVAGYSELLHPGPMPQSVGFTVYALVVLFLEPFYVAAGFGMYLNRRVELEAWDIEQEFRRAFA